MFQRLSGNFLKRCLGVDYQTVLDSGGSMPTDYGYIQLKGFVTDCSDEHSYIEPSIELNPSTTTLVVVNPAIETYRFPSVVEAGELVYAVARPDVDIDELDWVFRLYSIKR